jgi:hypothetical protein
MSHSGCSFLAVLPFPLCLSSSLGSETGFLLWGEEKALIRAFFLSRFFSFALGAFAFFALFFLRAFALFFWLSARERKSAKKAPAPTSV